MVAVAFALVLICPFLVTPISSSRIAPEQKVTDYYDVILDPVDLKMIGGRVRDRYYTSKDAFTRDLTKVHCMR